MNIVIESFNNCSFEEASLNIQKPEILNTVESFLKIYDCEKMARTFLVCFLINKFPKEILGQFKELNFEGIKIELTPLDKMLHNASNDFVNFYNKKNFIELNTKLSVFKEVFDEWKKKR